MLIYTFAEVHHNHSRQYTPTSEIDPTTGEQKLKAVSTVLVAGQIHDVHDDLAAECLALGCARELDASETQLHALAHGGTLEWGQ